MKNNNTITFTHLQTPEDAQILKAIVSHIYSIPRVAVWSCFSLLLCLGIVCGLNDENRTYGVPLAILAGVIFLGTLALMVYMLRARPQLLKTIEENTGLSYKLSFSEKDFTVVKDGRKTAALPYRQFIGQYWYEDAYIMHLRLPGSKNSGGDELFLVPLTEETFDSAYALAGALIPLKKRLVRIKGKQSRNGKSKSD